MGALFGALLAAVLYQLPLRGAVNIGDQWDSWFIAPQGVYPVEHGGGIDYRWTQGEALIDLPGLASNGTLTLSIWAAAQPGGAGAQALNISANGHALTPAPLSATPSRIDWTIDPGWLQPGGDLRLNLSTSVIRPPGENRDLGVLLDRMTIVGSASIPTWPDPIGVLAAALLGALATLIGSRRGMVLGAAFLALVAAGITLNRPFYGLHSPTIATLSASLILAIGIYRWRQNTVSVPLKQRIALNLGTGFWLALSLFSLYTLFLPGHFYVIDDDEKYAVTKALVLRGSLQMDPPIDGRVYSKYGLGHSLASAPLFLASLGAEKAFSLAQADDLQKAFVALLNPLCTAITAGVLYNFALLLWSSRRRALLIALTYGLATLAFAHALFAFSEPLITLLLLLGFYCLARDAANKRLPAPGSRLPSWPLLLSGVAFGLLLLTKLEFALVTPLALAYYLYTRRSYAWRELLRDIGLFALPYGICVLVLLAYNAARFASPFASGYAGEPFSTPLWTGLYGLVFSSGKSMLLYSPPLLLALLAWPRFWRRRRAEALFVTALSVGLLLFYARWWQWSGDWTWGPRFTLPLLPLLLLALGGLDFSRWSLRITTGALLALGVLAQAPGVLADWRLNFLRNGTAEQSAARMLALWFDPNWSPLLLDWRRMAIGPQPGIVYHLSDLGLPAWANFWTPNLLVALALIALAMTGRAFRRV